RRVSEAVTASDQSIFLRQCKTGAPDAGPQPLPSQQRPISRTSTVAHSVAGHWLAIATASAFVRQSRRKKPPTISLDSANGPSTTTRLPFRTAIRTPSASDLRESLALSTP